MHSSNKNECNDCTKIFDISNYGNLIDNASHHSLLRCTIKLTFAPDKRIVNNQIKKIKNGR